MSAVEALAAAQLGSKAWYPDPIHSHVNYPWPDPEKVIAALAVAGWVVVERDAPRCSECGGPVPEPKPHSVCSRSCARAKGVRVRLGLPGAGE